MRKTYLTAAVIAVALVVWLLSGVFGTTDGVREHPTLAQANEHAVAALDDMSPTAVRGRVIHAVPLPERVKVRGRTENKRTVRVSAETRGRVVERPVERGDQVAEGALLCRIAIEDRQAQLTQAKETVNQARIEYEGSLSLQDRGFQSDTAIAQARARLATAQAQLTAAVLDVERTQIRAPFAGVIEETLLEVGDYAQSGTPCATIVDLDPMLLVGRVSERNVYRFGIGAAASGRLATGTTVTGPVSFIGQQADPGTRTYRVEATIANPDYALRSGLTTEIDIHVGETLAHRVSPAVFALDDEGRVGVRIVDGDNRVRFQHVEIIADDDDGVWVRGLAEVTTLITVGQQFVVAGQLVDVQLQESTPIEIPTPPSAMVEERASAAGDDTELAS